MKLLNVSCVDPRCLKILLPFNDRYLGHQNSDNFAEMVFGTFKTLSPKHE
jgi:hypothetical protein